MRIKLGLPSLGGLTILFLDWQGRYEAGKTDITDLWNLLPPWAVLVAVILPIGLIGWDFFRERKEIMIVITPLALALTFTVLAIGGWAWFALDRAQGPVNWILDVGSPIDWQRTPNGPLWIIGFQIKGRNRWNEQILPSSLSNLI
jgi:hypothetical protein